MPQLVRTEIGLEQTNRVLRNHGTGGKGRIAAIVEMATTPVAPRMRNHLVETSEALARGMAVVLGVMVAEAPVVIRSVQGPTAKETELLGFEEQVREARLEEQKLLLEVGQATCTG